MAEFLYRIQTRTHTMGAVVENIGPKNPSQNIWKFYTTPDTYLSRSKRASSSTGLGAIMTNNS